MAGHVVGVFEDSSGQETPMGFRDSPGQWYTANHRKRGASPRVSGEPTQRDSQATQVASEGSAPVFVAGFESSEEDAGGQKSQPDADEVDEEETQIRMSNSEEQDGGVKAERKIFEQKVPLPLTSAAGGTMQESVDGATRRGDAVDTDDGDSDMSDDMLEQDGSVAGLSSIAASFHQREMDEEAMKKESVHVYKPRAPFRVSPAVSARDEDSSGGETEIEEEPSKEDPNSKPEKSKAAGAKGRTGSEDKSSPRLVKSSSESKALTKAPEAESIQRSLSTPDRNAKRDHEPDAKTGQIKAKRSRRSIKTSPSSSQDASMEKSEPLMESDGESKQVMPPPQEDSGFKDAPGSAEEIREAAKRLLSIEQAEVEKAPLLNVAPRVKQNSPAASHRRKRTAVHSRSVTDNDSPRSQAVGIRVILTGLDATPATRKKIKSIPGAVYEANIENATHVIAPQNQLKRTVKLLCGISCCEHIVGARWLDESAKAGAAVDEQANCLHDEGAESKWNFDLRKTMYEVPKEQRMHLFTGHHVFITAHKSVLPPVKDLVKIVECAGGIASSKGKPGLNDLVITSEAALATATVQKQLAHANPERIYSPELILSSILQQHVSLDKNQLKRSVIGETWATKRRK